MGQPNEPHTPAYQRHERALGRSRKQARFEGIMTLLLCAIVLVFSILLLIGWLIARTAPWYAYVALLVIAIAGIAFLVPAGIHAYRRGGLPVQPQEVIAQKEAHRHTLQEEAKGHLPMRYSLAGKIGSILLCLFFLFLAYSAWSGYTVSHDSEILVLAIVHSIFALLTGLLALVNFFGANAHQRSSAEELRQLLIEGEQTTTSDTDGI